MKEGVWAINIPAFCTQNTAIGSPQKTHNGVVKQLVNGLPSITLVHPCKAYSLGKQTRQVFHKGQAREAFAPLELALGDLGGPMQIPLSKVIPIFLTN